MFPLFYTGGNPTNLHVWHVTKPNLEQLKLWHEQPQVGEDLAHVASIISMHHRQYVFVLPPYRNDVYYLTNARTAPSLGHGYQLPKPNEFPWHDIGFMIVVNEQFDTHPERARYQELMQPILHDLKANGFVVSEQMKSMTVYRKELLPQRR